MGKTADNEAIKLTATYCNNMAVGLALGGALIPYLAFIQRASELSSTLAALKSGAFDNSDVKKLLFFFGAFFLALVTSRLFRARAMKEIAKLKD